MPAGRRPGAGRERGQLSFDFLVGMSVFLLAVGFVFGLAPGAFDPFSTVSGENMIAAERGAARLVEDALVASPGEPGILDSRCTVELFDDDDAVPAECRYETENLNEILGFEATMEVNATLETAGSVRTLDGTQLATGQTPPDSAGVAVAQRLVYLEGDESKLFVRVW